MGDWQSNDIGDYSLSLHRTTQDASAINLPVDVVVSGTLQAAVDLNTYSFSAAAGETFLLNMVRPEGSLLEPSWRLYGPNGSVIRTAETSGNQAWADFSTPLAGTYTLLVGDWQSNDIGDYSLILRNGSNPRPYVVISDDTLDTATGPVTFTFSFSEAVSGFDAADIVVIGGSLGAFKVLTSSTYTLLVQPDDPGSAGVIEVSVPAGVAINGGGQSNGASATHRQQFAPTATTLAIVAVNAHQLEGNQGTTSFTFAVSRSGSTSGTSTVQWAVAGSGPNPVNAADFGGNLPVGLIEFQPGDTSKTITLSVSGDQIVEADDAFTVTLFNAIGADIRTGTASGRIQNDDIAPPSPTVQALTTTDTTPLITGTAVVATGQLLQVQVNGRTYTLGSSVELELDSTTWSLAIPAAHALSDGTYNVTATLADAYGNSSPDLSSGELRIDTTPPAISMTAGSPTSRYYPLLSGSTEAGISLSIAMAGATWAVQADPMGRWSLDTSVAPSSGFFAPNRDGGNPFALTATDEAGNSASINGSVLIRYPYPDLQISSASLSGGPALSSVTLTYSASNASPDGPLLPAHNATASWVDRFYLSPDPVFGNGNDIAIGSDLGPGLGKGLAITSALAAGGSVSRSVALQLPDKPGAYYLIVASDADQAIGEGANEANNVFIGPNPLTISPIYGATVSTAVESLNAGQTLSLSGQLVRLADGVGVAGKVATVVFQNQTTGLRTERSVVSGLNGAFSVNFSPTAEQAGIYSIAARYGANPQEDLLSDGSLIAEDSVRVQGLSFLPGATVRPTLSEGSTFNGTLNLRNTGADALSTSGLSVSGAPAGWNVSLGSLPATLASGEGTTVTYSVTAPDATVLFDDFELVATASATGLPALIARQPLAVTILPNRPVLSVNQAQRSAAMLLGQRTLHEVTLINTGNAPSGPINVVLPNGAPWLSLYGASTLDSLAPGASSTIQLALNPPADLSLTSYQVPIGFRDEQHPAANLTVPFSFRAVSSATGSVSVSVYDDFSNAPGSPTVSNVNVRLYDRISDSLLQTINDADGRFSFLNLPVGSYAIEVSAVNHASNWQTFRVDPGDNDQLDVFLPSDVVRYSWVVVSTTVQDRYFITLEATLETEVPVPVVTITPAPVDLRSLDVVGENIVVPLTITNHGLVRARDLSFVSPVHPNYTITLLDDIQGHTLAPHESLVVNLSATRIANQPDAPCTMGLGELYWDYGTFLPTQPAPITVERDTPLPFLIAGDCPVIPGGFVGGGGGGMLWGIGDVITIAPSPIPEPYVTARVKIRINQDAVLSRDAFEGTFVLENLDPSIALSSIDIDLEIYDEDGQLVSDRFVISQPNLFGFAGALDGTGSLAANSSGTAVYTILAKDTAAPIEPGHYSIGGRVNYSRADGNVTFNLAPAAITVLPQPVLAFDYFLQRDVFSDDPFTTPLKEASQPFVLGLLAHNRGYGVANDLSITSGQPEIIENELGLKIGFDLIGSAVNGNAVLPSLSIDLGDLAPQSTSEAYWLMTSSLQGRFIDYSASFEYINALGLKDVPGLSQLTSVTLHELNHRVRDHRSGADSRFDYLVNDNPPIVGQDNTGKDLLPDTLYLSNDSTEPVTALAPSDISVSTINGDGQATVSFSAASGWTYLRLLEPSSGSRPITAVRRADGSLISADNFWRTDRTFPEHGRPTYESSLHILDYAGSGGATTYTLLFGAPTTNTAPTVSIVIADQQAKESEQFFFIVPSTSFLDPDAGDSLSYAASLETGSPLPSWLSFNADTRTFSGTPTATDVTTLSVRLTATDQGGLSVSDTFSLNVEPANYAPIVSTPIPNQTISTGVAWIYTLPAASFSDPNPADTLTYTARIDDGTASGAPLPAWLTFDPLSRSFSGTPADADASTLPVRVTATDPAGASISDTFNLIVSDTAGPSITGITVAGTQLQVQFSEPIVTTGLVASRFAATVGGSARSVASWASVAGDPTRLNLTLTGSAPTSSQAVTLRYTDLSSANDLTGVVQDAAGNDMATIAAPGLTATTFSSSASVASLPSAYTNLTLTGTAATATANSSNNRIRANQPTAVVNVFTGGGGIDDMDAAAGSDIYIIASAAHHSAAEISDTGTGVTDIDELRFSSITTGETLSVFAGDSGLERIAIGTGIAANPVTTATTALSINAAAAPNRLTITGNNGTNTLIGTAFNDILIGNGGNDAMDGRDGSDTYRITNISERSAAEINDTGTGASDIDELRFASTTANQTLILYAGDLGLESVVIQPGLVALNVNAAAAPNGLSITGNDAANLIVTTAYADLLDGRGGNDIYLVNSPDHRPAGESITDTGAAGIDELRFASITNGDTITINASDSGLERVTLGTGTATAAVLTAATSLHINAAASTNPNGLSLQGNYGFNTITGSSFNDRLNGNRGNDTLTGGAGADTFRFDSELNATTNRDTIIDFDPAEDRIQLENSVFTALTIPGPLAASQFLVGSSPTTANHRILYNNLTGTLTYDSNGTGSGGSTVFAVLPLGLGASMTATLFTVT